MEFQAQRKQGQLIGHRPPMGNGSVPPCLFTTELMGKSRIKVKNQVKNFTHQYITTLEFSDAMLHSNYVSVFFVDEPWNGKTLGLLKEYTVCDLN